jgi:hypothetical protein
MFTSIRSALRFVGFSLVFVSVCYLAVCVLALGFFFCPVQSLPSPVPAQVVSSSLLLPAVSCQSSVVGSHSEVVGQLSGLRVVELRALARSRGFTGVSRASRGRLLSLLG